jgi:hypothetical protein
MCSQNYFISRLIIKFYILSTLTHPNIPAAQYRRGLCVSSRGKFGQRTAQRTDEKQQGRNHQHFLSANPLTRPTCQLRIDAAADKYATDGSA